MKRRFLGIVIAGMVTAGAAFMVTPPSADAEGVTVYKDGDKYVKIGGRIQLQYHMEDPDGGSSTDSLAFRRLRPYIEGTVHKDWKGKFQWDMGEASGDNEIAVKDAYLEYTGVGGLSIKVGNVDAPFSRELLTSSKFQQLVERTFVGDHNYGTPDKNLGLHLRGGFKDNTITWGASAASASIDPDKNKLDFDTPVNKSSDFNEGWMIGGRVDYHPFGNVVFSQGDFDRSELKATIGVAAFTWNNDSDNNTYTSAAGADTSAGAKPDIDKVNGFEISGALRYMGVSVDAEYNVFDADTVDSTVTSGIFKDGSTKLKNFSVEGGYMVIPSTIELVAGYESQDADNYAGNWTRTSVGANYFFKKHDIKTQLTYRMGKDVDGVKDSDENELFIQAQYVF